MIEVDRVKKSTFNAFCVYFIYLLCYVLNLLASILLQILTAVQEPIGDGLLAAPILGIQFLSSFCFLKFLVNKNKFTYFRLHK